MQEGKNIKLATGTSLMADDRAIVSEAYAGDIIGLFDPGIFSIGDTLCTGKKHVQFAGIPTFAPEHFARVTQVDTMKRKQFVKGMEQIAQEGAIQIFRDLGAGMEEVIVGVVGVLQLEVLEYRLKNEYNVDIRMQTLPYEHLRWVLNDPEELDIKHLDVTSDTRAIEDMKGNPLLLFGSPWSINWAEQHCRHARKARAGLFDEHRRLRGGAARRGGNARRREDRFPRCDRALPPGRGEGRRLSHQREQLDGHGPAGRAGEDEKKAGESAVEKRGVRESGESITVRPKPSRCVISYLLTIKTGGFYLCL